MTIEDLLAQLDDGRPSGGGWAARPAAHTLPSAPGEAGRIVDERAAIAVPEVPPCR